MDKQRALELLDQIKTIGDEVDALEMAIEVLEKITYCESCVFAEPIGNAPLGIKILEGKGFVRHCRLLNIYVKLDEFCAGGKEDIDG